MAIERARASREQIIAYIEDVLFRNKTKKASYQDNINPDIKNVHAAIRTLEGREDFKAIYTVLNSDGQLQLQETALRVRNKYAKLVEKNIDTATDVLESSESIKDKATAVRLVNETIGALAPVSGAQHAPDNQGGGKLNRGSAIIDQ